jgi:hypothetical protein
MGMSTRSTAWRACCVLFLCADVATATAQEIPPTTGAAVAAPAPQARPAPTVWLLPSDARERLTYSLEVDASGRMLPGLPRPDRRSTAYHGRFVAVCDAPCAITLPPGSYSLGLGKDRGEPVPVPNALVVARDSTVIGHYESRLWRRSLGIAAIFAGVLGGGFFIASAFPAACASDGPCTSHGNAVTYGAGLLAVGTVAGILLLATGGDSATVTQN